MTIFAAVAKELFPERNPIHVRAGFGLYALVSLTATPLEGSYHLGQMIYNDCGPPHDRREPPERPSGLAESERLSLSLCAWRISTCGTR